MNIVSYLLFALTFVLGSFSARAEGAKVMVTVESHLEYKIATGYYDPQRADIKGNIARLEGELKLFEAGGSRYASVLADIARLQEWLGQRDKARMNRVKAFEMFDKNFYPTASGTDEFRSYIYLLNGSATASASCAKANDLFKTLFERNPDNILIYEFIPFCQISLGTFLR